MPPSTAERTSMSRRFALALLSRCVLSAMGASQSTGHGALVDPWVLERTGSGAEAEFLVVLREQADLSAPPACRRSSRKAASSSRRCGTRPKRPRDRFSRAFANTARRIAPSMSSTSLGARLARSRRRARASRRRRRIDPNPVVNGIVARVTEACRPDSSAASRPARSIEPNVAAINAPGVWALGFTGQGIVVGNAGHRHAIGASGAARAVSRLERRDRVPRLQLARLDPFRRRLVRR